MYGIQTSLCYYNNVIKFENDVKMYGIQTKRSARNDVQWFENDVKMYGIQTGIISAFGSTSLRMM